MVSASDIFLLRCTPLFNSGAYSIENMIAMQTLGIFFLLSFVYIIHGDYQYSSNNINCKRFENKVYLLTVTFPKKKPFNAALRLLPNGVFDELFSIANGNNAAEVGANFSLSNRIGYYKCLQKNYVRLTGLGFLYKTKDVPFLADNGAIVIHDYNLKFSNNDKRCTGRVKFAVFESGTNPFTTSDDPVDEGDIGDVKCELLKFRKYFDLSDD